MQVVRFQCPHCSANLKIRDDEIVGRPVDCPECRQPIVVGLDGEGKVSARRPTEPKLQAKKKAAKTTTAPPIEATAPPAAAVNRNGNPTVQSNRRLPGGGVAKLFSTAPPWIVATVVGTATVGMLALGFAFWPRLHQPGDLAKKEIPARADKTGPGNSATSDQPAAKKLPAGPQKSTVMIANAASRLTRLGELLEQYRKRQGNFPAGTTGQEPLRPGERLSWLAELAAGSLFADRPAPSWIEPWDSPRNDQFVRQQIPEFLNPAVEVRVSPRNYPATHFVGVAGVGEDAAELPVDHPRAGIFGNARTTRLEDIRDGASNTLMVVGATSDLGSWAAGGSATVRPFTREPYVNGPDGFGTGSTDRMTVLKADGSVVELSAATDPRIFRRMAAMADGLPLDRNVPGEPGDRSRRPTEPLGPVTSVRAGGPGDGKDNQPRHNSSDAEKPAGSSSTAAPASEAASSRSPIVASRPARPAAGQAKGAQAVNVTAGLAQHIVRFEQLKPVPLQDMLNFLEELLGVPIRGDKHEIADLDDLLQTPVTCELENTTVRQILKTVVAKVGLTFEVEPDVIHLRKAASVPAGGVH